MVPGAAVQLAAADVSVTLQVKTLMLTFCAGRIYLIAHP